MTSQSGKETIAIHILTNTSRSEGNQVMKFSQLIENNLIIFFLKNHTQITLTKLFLDLRSKKLKLDISG